MDKGVALSTYVNTAVRHFISRIILLEPFVAVTGSRNQMVKCNFVGASAERTFLFFHLTQCLMPLYIMPLTIMPQSQTRLVY